MKYYIKVDYSSPNTNAGYKASKDIEIILERLGYKALKISMPRGNRKLFFFKVLLQYIHIFIKLRRTDEIFVQYPYYTQFPNILYRFILLKKAYIKLIIHDLNSIRYDSSQEFLPILKNASLIIVHLPEMKEYLEKELKLTNDIRILYLFDYLLDYPCNYISNYKENIAYAGNLLNSKFLRKISIPTYVYGKSEKWLYENKNISYEGFFQPNDLRYIKGDWGLIWYGTDTVISNNTTIGKYLHYISPHKASLYIAAEKPIIIWKGASLSKYIEKEKLGLCIDSLNEIESKIKNLSEEEKNEIKNSIKKKAEEIKNGCMLVNILR